MHHLQEDAVMEWLVCENPERPIDGNAQWHIFGGCRGCVVAMQARVARGDEPSTTRALLVLEPAP